MRDYKITKVPHYDGGHHYVISGNGFKLDQSEIEWKDYVARVLFDLCETLEKERGGE